MILFSTANSSKTAETHCNEWKLIVMSGNSLYGKCIIRLDMVDNQACGFTCLIAQFGCPGQADNR